MIKSKIYTQLKNQNIPVEQDVFNYGYFVFIQYVKLFFILIPLSYKFNILLETMLFTLLFLNIRKFLGGFHFKSSNVCLAFSIFISLIIPLVNDLFVISYKMLLIITFLSYIFIYKINPIDSPLKQINKIEKRLYKRKALFHIRIYIIASIILLFYNECFAKLILLVIISITINLIISLKLTKNRHITQH